MSQKPSQNAKNIGARFRSARSLVLSLNRKSFCERYEINRYTMQSWENGLHVSKGKNVEKFIEALAREGIACTAEWLIDGTGDPARPFDDRDQTTIIKAQQEKPADSHTQRLLALYEEDGESVISCLVNDDSMAPWFKKGDEVFGIDISQQPERAHQKWVIVDLGEDRQVVRKALLFKDQLLLMAEERRVPCFSLAAGASIHEVIWHRMRQ